MKVQEAQSLSWHAQLLPLWCGRSHTIARSWFESILPLMPQDSNRDETESFIQRLTDRVIGTLSDAAWNVEEARAIGAALAEHFSDARVLGCTQEVLGRCLLERTPRAQRALLRPKLSSFLSEVAVGFVAEREQALNRTHHSFLAHMRHELGTPLTAITGFSHILLEGMDGDLNELQAKDIRAIQAASEYLTDILNDISDLYKIEMGRLRVQPRPFEVVPFLDELARGLQDTLGRNGNTLRLQVDESVSQIVSDRKKVERLLRSLISHASWSTREGDIVFELTRDLGNGGEQIHFKITDNGTGLSAEQVAELSHHSADTEFLLALEMGSPGLGLLLARRLCELLGGEFAVRSGFGKGARYEIRLPVLETNR